MGKQRDRPPAPRPAPPSRTAGPYDLCCRCFCRNFPAEHFFLFFSRRALAVSGPARPGAVTQGNPFGAAHVPAPHRDTADKGRGGGGGSPGGQLWAAYGGQQAGVGPESRRGGAPGRMAEGPLTRWARPRPRHGVRPRVGPGRRQRRYSLVLLCSWPGTANADIFRLEEGGR